MEIKRVLVAGGSGLVGSELLPLLAEQGYEVAILSRSGKGNRSYAWDPENGYVDPEAIRFADAIINLSGANVASYWTEAYKKKITDSRTQSNAVLLAACIKENRFPKVYLSAGGMNYYGDSGDSWMRESDPAGKEGFLPGSCVAWENAVSLWKDYGVRTAQFRISLVLSMKGGALPKMLMTLPARILPVFGDGNQWYSWIHIRDLANLFLFSLKNEAISGIYNAASPEPWRMRNFLRHCASAHGVHAWYPSIPEFMVKIMLGQMSETVLTSIRLSVERLEQAGFTWMFPELEKAVRDLRKKS
jgi:uncharacterized protein